jgi:lytic murein transglycosylase
MSAPLALALFGAATPILAQDIEFGPPTTKKTAKPIQEKKPAVPAPGTAAAVPATTPPPTTPSAVSTPAPAATARIKTISDGANTKFDPSNYKPAPANCRNSGSFETWLADFRREVEAEGLSKRAISLVLDGMTLDSGVIARDRRGQGIFGISFVEFSTKLATPQRVQSGRAQITKNRAAFERVEKQYGVPPSVITGFWALESDFGAGMGNLPILRSIAALAYDCRRGPMFREELRAAIQIIERGDMMPAEMVGSWAGEIGQTQFLPTRYLEHAIDYDGDGKINLFRNNTDIIGTTANYMSHLGWRSGEPWLEEVRVPAQLAWDQAELAIKHPRSKWASWGVTRVDGSALSSGDLPASLLLPMGRYGPAFLAYPNFDVYLKWNQSLNYATTAAYLATRIDGAAPMRKPSQPIAVLDPEDAKELQRQLVKRGFDVGEVDAKIGAATRSAVKAMQIKYQMPADSYPTPELLAALKSSR